MKDYSQARYFAITEVGYGRGFTAQEALDNLTKTIKRDFRHLKTAQIKEALPDKVWKAPEGATGFIRCHFMNWSPILWTADDGNTQVRFAIEEDLVDVAPSGVEANPHEYEPSEDHTAATKAPCKVCGGRETEPLHG